MDFNFEGILTLIFYVGAFQGVILSIFLFTVKANILSNRFLGLLTICWAIILVGFAQSLAGLMSNYPHFLRTFSHIEFAFHPLLYLSVKYLVFNYKKFRRVDLLHFLPLLLNILLYAGFYFRSPEEKLLMVNSNEGYYYVANFISDLVLSLQGIVYPILVLRMLQHYKRNIVDYQSNIDKTVLEGMKIGASVILVAWIIGTVAANLYNFNIRVKIDLFLFVYLAIVFVIYVISYIAIRSSEVFKISGSYEAVNFSTKKHSTVQTNGREPPKKNQLEDSNDDEILLELDKKLLAYMDEEKPYLNPELSLQDLANNLGVSRHQLSAVINQNQKMNFYEFVNTYRVNEMCSLMEDPKMKNYKIISLAFDAGFNSKASFNRIFKQLSGRTPSDYMASLKSV